MSKDLTLNEFMTYARGIVSLLEEEDIPVTISVNIDPDDYAVGKFESTDTILRICLSKSELYVCIEIMGVGGSKLKTFSKSKSIKSSEDNFNYANTEAVVLRAIQQYKEVRDLFLQEYI